jgi:hypothetical protein
MSEQQDQNFELEEVLLEAYINKTWPKLKTRREIPLKDLFPEPDNKGLKHIWKYGHGDVVVEKDDKILAIIEPGGSHHLKDEKQKRNDRRKFKLCEQNGARCLHYMNGVLEGLPSRKRRSMIGGAIFGYK